jgi:hypothetical protein
MKILESYSLFSAADTILKKLGIFEKVERLGKGEHGVAYYYDNKVYKITDDSLEVELAYILLNEKSRHYVQIFDIFCFDTGEGDDNINNLNFFNPRYYWVIIQEYIDTSRISSWDLQHAILYFDRYTHKNFNYTKAEFDKIIEDFKDEQEYDFDGNTNEDSDEELAYLKIIKNLFLDLQKYGIKNVIDLKMNNLGKSKDGQFKFFDLRFSEGTTKDINNIKRLN